MNGTPASPDDARPGQDPAAPASVTAVVGLLVLFELMSGFLQTGITPLLPELGEHHGIGDSTLNWIVSVQLLAGAVMVPVFGRLGDLYGHRRMLRLAIAAVAAGSLLVALAPTFPVLLLGRVFQGALVALLPLEIALVRDRLPVEHARRAIARLVGALTLGGLLGAVVMGAAAKAVDSIQLVLLVPALFALLCVPVSFLFIPESVPKAVGRPDWPGAALLGLSLLSLLGGVSRVDHDGWTSAGVLLPLGLFAVLMSLWVRTELRCPAPLVDLRAMKGRGVGRLYLVSFFFGVMYFGSQSPNATFLAADPTTDGYGFGLTALDISLVSLPGAVAALFTSACTALIARRLGYRGTLLAAFGLMAAGFLGLACLHDSVGEMVIAVSVCGAGVGAALGAMPTVIVEATEPQHTGVASALYNNVKTVGGAVSGGVVASLLASHTKPGGTTPYEGGYTAVWLLCAVCGLCAIAAVAGHGRGGRTGSVLGVLGRRRTGWRAATAARRRRAAGSPETSAG
ncbi:MFS transporter [Streptomyces sp. NPDC026665]|uniref:MFS transporter n=1 Tax=Streptomyces sp. NPDC026665 TaxID=3154798 RepID=UPI0033CDBC2D